nr:hypothetical protein [Prevotella sp.]
MYKGNKGFVLKFGDLAKTLSLEDWKTTSLEDLDSDTEWVAIVTDDAEAYLNEINAIVTKMKHPKTCFVIDLHPCANYKHLQKLWDNYMMVDRESVEVLLSFIHHHLVNHSMISFTIQDFRVCSVPYPFVKAVSADIVKDAPIDPNAQAMCYGLCFEQACGLETSYVNAFAKTTDKIDEDKYVPWSIQYSSDNVIEAIFFYERKF